MTHHLRVLSCVLFFASITLAAPAARSDETDKSPFTGNYSGNFTHIHGAGGHNQQGTITFSIDAKGKIAGHAKNNTAKNEADITGSVSEDGEFKITAEWPNITTTGEGTVTKTKKGNFKGTLTAYVSKDKSNGSVAFDLSPKAPVQKIKSGIR